MSTIEERFQAAVNVIRGLPKNGSYQPSRDMMLKFYSYFKQATEGPNNLPKPAFWDVVNKAKWDAWHKLGDMSKDRAMENYVEELKKIIETMSYSHNVANFMGSINELDGVDVDDLEAIAPETIKKVRSHPNSPFASRESSPNRAPLLSNGGTSVNVMNGNGTTILTNGNGAYINGNGINGGDYSSQNGHGAEHSDDEYIDTLDDDSDVLSYRLRNGGSQTSHVSRTKSRFNTSSDSIAVPILNSNDLQINRMEISTNLIDVLNKMNQTVEKMNVDIQTITKRLDSFDKTIQEINKSNKLNKSMLRNITNIPEWWPFNGITPKWFLFMILWPYIAKRLILMVNRKRT